MHIVTLNDPSSPLAAQFVPEAGMIGTSLTDAGTELLGQRRGLQAYVEAGKTMGIPILYPWANRLGANTYTAEDATVTLTAGENGVRADPNGLPIHGVLAADPGLLASFPSPHVLTVAVRLADRALTIRTTVTATGDTAVPLCFGFHPYLRLPDVARGEWIIETPPLRHLRLDDRGLPTGESESQPAREEPLGDKAFDDAYDQVSDGAVFAVSGGRRRLEVHFEHGYPATQIFAPPAEDLVCFEPMTAPTAAFRGGGSRGARPGEPAPVQFPIKV